MKTDSSVKTDPRVDEAHGDPPWVPPQSIYFDSGDFRLFGWLHTPPASAGGLGLVICKPFGYEAICAHRALRVIAERAAAAGIPALRFDYVNSGDSEDLEPGLDQISAWTQDIVSAIEALKQRTRVRRVCVLGVRLGAMLAVLAARQTSVDALILIAPTVSGHRYLREFKATRLASTMRREQSRSRAATVETKAVETREDSQMEVAGFAISAATVASLDKVELLTLTRPPAPRMLILDARGFAAARTWASKLGASDVRLIYKELAGPMEMVMTAPQFGIGGQEVVSAVQAWLQELSEEGAPHLRAVDQARSAAVFRDEPLSSPDGWVREAPVMIPADVALFGILTRPRPEESRRRAVILLNAAADYHIGPGRMYVSLARGWARHGYFVLRLDLAGLGDSATRAGQADDVVFTDGALEDIRAAIHFLRTQHGIRDITVAGLCSGAYHALRAAMEGLPVNRILMVNPLNFISDKDAEHSELKLAEVIRGPNRYRERLFSFRHWSLLLRGRVSVWRILTIYLQRLTLALESGARDLLRALHVRLARDLGRELERIAARGVSMVFVFARGEPGFELLKLQAGSALSRLGTQCRIHIIDSGDHIFGRSGPRSILESILSEELFAPAPWFAAHKDRDSGVLKEAAGVPTGIRTPVTSVKGMCPRPLDDGDMSKNLVEPGGIEPPTSCMPCKRSPS